MINFEDVTGENIQEQNPDWLQIPEHSYRILIVGGSGKTNALLELISHQPHIDKIFGSIRAEASVSHKQVWREWSKTYQLPKGFTAILNDTIQERKEKYW